MYKHRNIGAVGDIDAEWFTVYQLSVIGCSHGNIYFATEEVKLQKNLIPVAPGDIAVSYTIVVTTSWGWVGPSSSLV